MDVQLDEFWQCSSWQTTLGKPRKVRRRWQQFVLLHSNRVPHEAVDHLALGRQKRNRDFCVSWQAESSHSRLLSWVDGWLERLSLLHARPSWRTCRRRGTVKRFREPVQEDRRRFSPPQIIGTRKHDSRQSRHERFNQRLLQANGPVDLAGLTTPVADSGRDTQIAFRRLNGLSYFRRNANCMK